MIIFFTITVSLLLAGVFALLLIQIEKTEHWRKVATGEINDPVAHIECQKELTETEVKVTYLRTEVERLKRKNHSLEKVFNEKVLPAVSGAAAELAAWIKEEEDEMRNKAGGRPLRAK